MMLLVDGRGTSEVGVRPDYIWFGNLCWAALGVYSPALLTVY